MIDLEALPGLTVYPGSVTTLDGTTYFLATGTEGKALGVLGDASGFQGRQQGGLTLCPLDAGNASALRARLPWLRPQTLGLARVAGCGDRLGLATPGHVRAVRQVGGFVPIFAQQSMRENARTGRTPQQVVDDAIWGIFQEGWREPWGADADHLKTLADVDLCVDAGYTFFTVDPGDHVDNEAHTAPVEVLEAKLRALPWDALDDSTSALQDRYLGRSFAAGDVELAFDATTLARAAAKYGRAIAHTARMYRHLAAKTLDFELEMSVDETDTPTSVAEHFFIASELQRLGVEVVSLAPRYVGSFEKGVDYIGDLDAFDTELAKHAAIARALGPYKLSIHSGSDKYSIYPIFAKHAGDLVHLKTAGTSYLQELCVAAEVDPGLFRQILALAIERYPQDRATYHVSAQLSRVPGPDSLPDEDLPGVLDLFDAREVLHVTFGSALDAVGHRLLDTLRQNEELHYALLDAHFQRHLRAFLTLPYVGEQERNGAHE